VKAETAAKLARAQRRCEWAALALAAAADELDLAGGQGVVIGSTPELLRTEAACADELTRRVGEVRALAADERRLSDHL
jgi:hypothetical protein